MAKPTVPLQFQPLLPSSSVTDLNPNRDKYYIIESLLKKATLDAWKWMLRTYATDEIVDVIKNSRTLTPRDVYVWTQLFNISREEIACLQKSSQKTQKSSWVY